MSGPVLPSALSTVGAHIRNPPPLRITALLLAFAFELAIPPPAARAAELQLRGQAATILGFERNRPRPLPLRDDGLPSADAWLQPELDTDRLELFLGVGADVWFDSGFGLHLQLDSGGLSTDDGELLANGRPAADEAKETGFLREGYVDWVEPTSGWLESSVGRRHQQIASGLVFDEIATGAHAAITIDAIDVVVDGGASLVGRDLEPEGGWLFTGRVGWSPDPLSGIAIFGAAYRDDGAGAGQFFEAVMLERFAEGRIFEQFLEGSPVVESSLERLFPDAPAASTLAGLVVPCIELEGDLRPWWLGLEGQALVGGHRFDAVGIVAGGTAAVDIDVRAECDAVSESDFARNLVRRFSGERAFDLRGYAADASWRYALTPSLFPGVFLTWMSGDADIPADGDAYGAFPAIAPYVTRTVIFFGSGVGTGYRSRTASSAGVAGRGVWAPGARLLWSPIDVVEVTGVIAPLYADVEGSTGGRHYGLETDLKVWWRVADAWTAEAEGAVLFPGDFYPDDAHIWQITLSATGTVESP